MAAWSYLKKLTTLPHRGSASAAEATAARLIRTELEKLGFTVDYQHFRSPRKTLYYGPSVIIAIYLFSAFWLGVAYPLLAVILMVLAALPLVGELIGSPLNLDALLPKYRSQNLVARLLTTNEGETVVSPGNENTIADDANRVTTAQCDPIPSTAGEITSANMQEDRVSVVVTAHYDTQYGSWLFAPNFRPYLQLFFTTCYASLVILPLALALRTLFPGAVLVGSLIWVASLYLALVFVLLVLASFSGKYTNGANDNGSGTALALELANRAAAGGFPNLDMTFAFTGSEETGTRGMSHFIALYQKINRESTFFVNLDNLGAGIPRYLEGEGMLKYTPYDADLISLAQQISAATGGKVIAKHNLLLPTDGVVAARAGFPSITFIAMDAQGNIPDYHWHTDTIDRVDATLVEFMENYITKFISGIGVLARKPTDNGMPG